MPSVRPSDYPDTAAGRAKLRNGGNGNDEDRPVSVAMEVPKDPYTQQRVGEAPGGGRPTSGGMPGFKIDEHRGALLKSPEGLVEYANQRGISNEQIKALIDDNYSSKAMAAKQYQLFLKAGGGK